MLPLSGQSLSFYSKLSFQDAGKKPLKTEKPVAASGPTVRNLTIKEKNQRIVFIVYEYAEMISNGSGYICDVWISFKCIVNPFILVLLSNLFLPLMLVILAHDSCSCQDKKMGLWPA